MPVNKLKPRTLLLALIVLLFIIRLAFLIIFESTLNFELPGNAIHGSEAYDAYALNLNATGIYGRIPGVPDAQIPPLYSYMLAAVYTLFGRGYMQIGILHTIMDAFSIVLLYDICRRLFNKQTLWNEPAGTWVGLLAGLFFALYPYLTFQNLTLIDTPFWILFLHGFTWLIIRIREQPAINRETMVLIAAAGLVLGLSILARPIIMFYALLIGLWYLLRLNLWQTLLRLVPVALIGVLVVVPWIIRNYRVFDAFVPMSTTSGSNLWQGNSKWTIPVFRAGYDVQWTAPDPEDITHPLQSREADAQRFQLVLDWWRENPDKLPELLWVKFLVHWSIELTPRYNPQEGESFALDENGEFYIATGETTDGVTVANASYNQGGLLDTLGRPVHIVYYGTLLLLALAGIVLSIRQWRDVSILVFVQIGMMIVYLIFHPSTRYRAPSDPLLFALSACAVIWFLMQVLKRRHPPQKDASA